MPVVDNVHFERIYLIYTHIISTLSYGLGAGIFTKDLDVAFSLAHRLEAGTIYVMILWNQVDFFINFVVLRSTSIIWPHVRNRLVDIISLGIKFEILESAVLKAGCRPKLSKPIWEMDMQSGKLL